MQSSLQQELEFDVDHSASVCKPSTISDLNSWVTVCTQLIGVDNMSDAEKAIAGRHETELSANLVTATRREIMAGGDPLGIAYSSIKPAKDRRSHGQTFTPGWVVSAMFDSIGPNKRAIGRIIDPGAGTGRFVIEGLRRMPRARGIAVETDHLLAIGLRANAHVAGISERLQIISCDYRDLEIDEIGERTLFIGNPPYVRHHEIPPYWKCWYSDRLKRLGRSSSQLAGLHLHFFLKTALLAAPGDVGSFITAAEWLDVNYGLALRELFLNELGGSTIHLMPHDVPVFGDAMVSACITSFEFGQSRPSFRFNKVNSPSVPYDLSGGREISRETARAMSRWSVLMSEPSHGSDATFVELGEMFRICRGQVTGNNKVWVASTNGFGLPQRFLFRAITAATDITCAKGRPIDDPTRLRFVIDLPASLSALNHDEHCAVERFLKWARSQGADQGYIARHRNPWWRVNLKSPPPIVMTYMGRRPPVFALNSAGARLVNVAHGLYPLRPISAESAQRLVAWLNCNVSQEAGRTYAGGLTKFEPSEAMRLKVPALELLDSVELDRP